MQKKKLFGLTKQIYLAQGSSDDDVYLCMVGLKADRDVNKEELKFKADIDDVFELQLFDVVNQNNDKPIGAQFDLTAFMRKGFAFNNRSFQQGIFLNRNLEV